MSYKSPVSGSELVETNRENGAVLVDTVTGDTFTPEYAKENLEEFKRVKKEKKAPAKTETAAQKKAREAKEAKAKEAAEKKAADAKKAEDKKTSVPKVAKAKEEEEAKTADSKDDQSADQE